MIVLMLLGNPAIAGDWNIHHTLDYWIKRYKLCSYKSTSGLHCCMKKEETPIISFSVKLHTVRIKDNYYFCTSYNTLVGSRKLHEHVMYWTVVMSSTIDFYLKKKMKNDSIRKKRPLHKGHEKMARTSYEIPLTKMWPFSA